MCLATVGTTLIGGAAAKKTLKPSSPAAAPLPKAAPPPPTAADPRVKDARSRNRRRASLASRGSADLSEANVEKKSLLGS